jgi:PAS domain-containing protein
VFAGETVRFAKVLLVMTRHGYPEETWWNFFYSPVRDEFGVVAGLLNVTEDGTGKVRGECTETALRESETRLRNVLNGMDEAFGILDHDFSILTFNDAALRLETRPLEDILGRTH